MEFEGNPDWDKDERGNVQEFSWMSEPLDAETTEKLEKISEETFGNSMIYVMPYYLYGRTYTKRWFSSILCV